MTGFPNRLRVEGKFFWQGNEKHFLKGVTFGPFAPNAEGERFGSRDQIEKDFVLFAELGLNLLRVYFPPPRWLLDLALEKGIWFLVDVPWRPNTCFLEDAQALQFARDMVLETLEAIGGHPAVMGISVMNEVPPDIARWLGPGRVAAFLCELVQEVHSMAPGLLCTFSNYPPTEYLDVPEIDFHCFNVYLHHPVPWGNYLDRLMMLSGDKPLVIGEAGMDSLREGEERQAVTLGWQIEEGFKRGLAGFTLFSFTDAWYQSDVWIRDWRFGLTRENRERKPAFYQVQKSFRQVPFQTVDFEWPFVSVVVASYNGGRTLKECLGSLVGMNYPQFEVLLVDDGSTPSLEPFARLFPMVRFIRNSVNQGLSAARNAGIEAGEGRVVAFTDDDCRVDPDWLYYLVHDLSSHDWVGVGGPNLLPSDDSDLAAAIFAAPGGPMPVLLTNRLAEHLPGCNMAFYKWALVSVDGFDPIFRQAGDDIDLCWRLQQKGFELGYSPAAMVHHYRRATPWLYLKQQMGYGSAETLVRRKHPDRFNFWGNARWRGVLYGGGSAGIRNGFGRSTIYHGTYGSAYFQTLYSPNYPLVWMIFTSLEWHVGVILSALLSGWIWGVGEWIALGGEGVALTLSFLGARRVGIPWSRRRWWSTGLVTLLFFTQPVARGFGRYRRQWGCMVKFPAKNEGEPQGEREDFTLSEGFPREIAFKTDRPVDRHQLLNRIQEVARKQGWEVVSDTGWDEYDLRLQRSAWNRMDLLSVVEEHGHGKQVHRFRLRVHWTPFACILGLGGWVTMGLILFWLHSWMAISSAWVISLGMGIGLIPWGLLGWDGRKSRRALYRLMYPVWKMEGLLGGRVRD